MSSRTLDHNDSRRLLRWLPFQLLMVALMLVGGVATIRMMDRSANLVKDSVTITTDGAKGSISGDELVLELPVKIYNGTSAMIVGITVWTTAYACPDEATPKAQCTRVHSSEQALNLRVAAGSSGSQDQEIRTGLPSRIAGDHIRVERKVTGVTSDVEAAEQRMRDQP